MNETAPTARRWGAASFAREAMMDKAEADSARGHIARAAEIIDGHGTLRMRILMRMVLAEIEKERAQASAASRPQPAGQ